MDRNRDMNKSEGNNMGNQARGNWQQFKGKLREKWGDLTDDELDQVQGRREQLVGRITERSGSRRDEVEREVDNIGRSTNYRFE